MSQNEKDFNFAPVINNIIVCILHSTTGLPSTEVICLQKDKQQAKDIIRKFNSGHHFAFAILKQLLNTS